MAFAANISGVFEQDPLFKEANFLPGDSITRWAKITNTSGKPQIMAAQAINFLSPLPADDLARALEIKISSNGIDLYGGTKGAKTLSDFFNDGVATLNNLADGATAQYDFTISFPYEKGNEWQLKQTIFDILIGLKNEGGGIDIPPTRLVLDGGGGGMGGQGGQCVLAILEPTVQAQNITMNTADILWRTNCLSTSQVVYSSETQSRIFDLLKPNFGYAAQTSENLILTNGHQISLAGLLPETTYYYKVVSRSGGGSLEISREHQFRTPGVRGSSTFEDNLNPDTLGNAGENETGGIVAGTSTAPELSIIDKFVKGVLGEENSCGVYEDLPWIILLLTAGMSLYEEYRLEKIKKKLKETAARIPGL